MVISQAITNLLVVIKHSQATLEKGSCSKQASKIASDIWSQILSGCHSVTDSEVINCFVICLYLYNKKALYKERV